MSLQQHAPLSMYLNCKVWLALEILLSNHSDSTTKVQVNSICAKIVQYEPKKIAAEDCFIKLVPDSEPKSSDLLVGDVVIVVGGRVHGSCGASYFTGRHSELALHVGSLDVSPKTGTTPTRSQLS